nr:ATP-binding cassette domain-containing protein [Actinomycetota bacterium]NIS31844.1 ATP-binding cassette domain-containing protein [Actinomycetota bacterium]NIT95922.1 ATP-binding cassette domain-containing protein [Actinomycetota bacterium]NIU19599.1 ATP-binding cassette domain-containing protein [Actinomycetota bacterium]NIU66937.1 ATP-binding cassette domain-containing protein [Actinomycetota bacterium]
MSGSGLRARIVARRSEEFDLDVDLAIDRGTTVALLGPNGAGKSTAVDALAGTLPLVGGRIRLDDRILDDPVAGVFVPVEERRVGVVFQQYLLFDHLDVLDNIAFGPAVAGRSRREAREVASRLVDTF